MQRENFQACRSPSTLEARIPGKFILQAEYPPKKKMRSFQLAPQKWDHMASMAIPNQSSDKEIQGVEGKNEKKRSAKQISKSSAETQSVCLLP